MFDGLKNEFGAAVRAPEGARLAAKASVVKEDLEKLQSGYRFQRGGKLLHQSQWSLVLDLPQTAAPLVIKYPQQQYASDATLAAWLFEHQVDAAKAIQSLGRKEEDGFYGPSNLLVGFEYLANDRHQRRDAEPRKEAQKEGHPRHVERAHVRCAEIQELNPRGFAM